MHKSTSYIKKRNQKQTVHCRYELTKNQQHLVIPPTTHPPWLALRVLTCLRGSHFAPTCFCKGGIGPPDGTQHVFLLQHVFFLESNIVSIGAIYRLFGPTGVSLIFSIGVKQQSNLLPTYIHIYIYRDLQIYHGYPWYIYRSLYIPWISMVYIEISIYTIDIHGIS